MIIFNRIIPFVTSVLALALLEVFILFYSNVFVMVLAVILALLLALWQLHGRKILQKDLWNFFITPTLLIAGAFLFLLFLENETAKQAVVIITTLFILLFLNNVFLYRFQPFRYRAYALENISSYLNLIAFWFWFSSFFGFIILIDVPVWFLTLAAFVVTGALYYSACWINKLDIKKIYPHILILGLIIAEIFVAVSFLPTSFYVNGLLLAGFYYGLAGLSRAYILKTLDKKVFLRYTVFSLLIIIAVLATARWS